MDPKARLKMFRELADKAALNGMDHTHSISSKYINFFLTYDHKDGPILDPMIAEIIQEIKDDEWDPLPPRKPRKKKRPVNADRRFKQAVRIIVLNLLQLTEIIKDEVYLAISKDANAYNLQARYSPPDMTYDPFIEAYEGLKHLG